MGVYTGGKGGPDRGEFAERLNPKDPDVMRILHVNFLSLALSRSLSVSLSLSLSLSPQRFRHSVTRTGV